MHLKLVKGNNYPRTDEVLRLEQELVHENHPKFTGEEKRTLLFKRLSNIVLAVNTEGVGNFWVMEAMDGTLGGVALTHYYDVDGQRTALLDHMFVSPYLRGTKFVKESIQEIVQHAKENKCTGCLIISRRKRNDVVCRFLGTGWHENAVLLRKNL